MFSRTFVVVNILMLCAMFLWTNLYRAKLATDVEARLKKNASSMIEHQRVRGYITEDEAKEMLKEQYIEIEEMVAEDMKFSLLSLGGEE